MYDCRTLPVLIYITKKNITKADRVLLLISTPVPLGTVRTTCIIEYHYYRIMEQITESNTPVTIFAKTMVHTICFVPKPQMKRNCVN